MEIPYVHVQFERPETSLFNPEIRELCFVTILQTSYRETKTILSLWIEFCRSILLVNDAGVRNHCTVRPRQFWVPHPISTITTKHHSLEHNHSLCRALSWGDTQPLKHSKSYRYRAKRKGEEREGGKRDGGWKGWKSLGSCGKCQRDTFCWNTGCAEWWENGYSSV